MSSVRSFLVTAFGGFLFLTPATMGAGGAVNPGGAGRGWTDSPGVALRVPALESAARRAGLRPHVFDAALRGYRRALRDGVPRPSVLTVIDYSLPSRERRLWVLDLVAGSVLMREFVAHGRGTGLDVARKFSNIPGSLQSSLGAFITGGTYEGQNGQSLRLRGVDRGLNDRAEERAIVVHGAWYVSDEIVRQQGRLGRSEGCPALSEDVAPRVIDLIRDGTVLFSYYPSPDLERSLAAS